MKPIVDHLQITVRDLEASLPFYDEMFAILGFDVSKRSSAKLEKFDMHVVEYIHPELAIAFSSPREAFADETVHRRRPGAIHHLAFRAGSNDEVDEKAAELRKIGATIVGGPKLWPEHGPDYYAVFWKDPDGIKYEIVHCPHGH